MIDWRLLDLQDTRLMVEFIGGLTNNVNRKIGQVITYDTTNTDLNNMLAGKVASTDKFLIFDIVYQPDGAIRIATIGL